MKQRIPSFKEFINESEIRLNKGNDTIQDYLIFNKQSRIDRLKEIKAPEIMIQNDIKMIENYKSGNVKINGWNEFSQEVFKSFIWKKGNGGKEYVQFTLSDNSIVNYFPNGKFGPFFSRPSK